MPLFEFRCVECQNKFTFQSGVVAGNSDAKCPRCGSENLKKLMSRFSRGRSDDERMDALAERLEGADGCDAGAMRQLAREIGREMEAESGESLGDEIEEQIEREARGESGEGDLDGSEVGGAGGGLGGGQGDSTIY